MNSLSLPVLRDTADQFATLAGILQTPSSAMKAHAIRKADKALVSLEAFFTTTLMEDSIQWKRANEALAVLLRRLEKIQEWNEVAANLKENINKIEDLNNKWLALSGEERAKFSAQARLAKQYIDGNTALHEAHIINRYERLRAVQPLVPFADNAEVLCEAIHHFQNRERYEENISKLQVKVEQGEERLKSVKRGFYLAAALCILLVTIPLCLPFAFSLWTRRKEIEKQIANTRESIRREERRLVAADEGVIAHQEIKDVLGDAPLEQIRLVLAEVKELRSEFHGHQVASSHTASLLSFLEQNRTKLEELFGSVELNPPQCFHWLVEKISIALSNQGELERLRFKLHEANSAHNHMLKGHSMHVLERSIAQLFEVKQQSLSIGVEDDLKREFADLCIRSPEILRSVRETLWQLSRCHPVEDAHWKFLQTQTEIMSNVFNACIVNMEVVQMWGSVTPLDDEPEEADSRA